MALASEWQMKILVFSGGVAICEFTLQLGTPPSVWSIVLARACDKFGISMKSGASLCEVTDDECALGNELKGRIRNGLLEIIGLKLPQGKQW